MRDFFDAMLSFVKREKVAGKSIEEVKKAEAIPGFESMKEMLAGALAMNIDNVYRFLK